MDDFGTFAILMTEECWETGNYTPDCDCSMCAHRDECSGNEDDDED